MTKYRITSYEVYTQQYMVEAESQEEAEKAFLDGDGYPLGEADYNGSLTEEYNLINSIEIEQENEAINNE